MKKTIILAGNREQFERYLDNFGKTDSECVYGYSPEAIYGVEATNVVVTGTFWDRKDAHKLKELADSRIR